MRCAADYPGLFQHRTAIKPVTAPRGRCQDTGHLRYGYRKEEKPKSGQGGSQSQGQVSVGRRREDSRQGAGQASTESAAEAGRRETGGQASAD